MSHAPKTRVRVVSDRCGTRGEALVVLSRLPLNGQAEAMYACRPEHDADWDGRLLFYTERELATLAP